MSGKPAPRLYGVHQTKERAYRSPSPRLYNEVAMAMFPKPVI